MTSASSLFATCRRAVAVAAAMAATLALAGCFDSNTTTCSSGVVCPEGSVCTADGLGCRQLANQCGNGQMDEGETCDDGNQIDEDDCRADCQVNVCGDGKRDLQGDVQEECDELGGADSATCNSDCTIPRCGDNRTNPMFIPPGAPRGERCDDGNNTSGDGCSADCASDESCGDSYVNDDLPTTGAACLTATGTGTNCPELCDDGNRIAGDGCSPNCLSEETCRNGILDVAGNGGSNPPELCDDGDTDDADECRNNCQAGFGCGNGFVDNDGPSGPQFDEECDNGSTVNSAECDGDCTIPVCGDNEFNMLAGESCDPGAVGVNVASCNSDCTVPACGDGKVNRAFTPAGATGPEQCDDNNTTAGDGCSATCQIETCGNGVTETINGEQCDDGNLVDTDACRNTCQFPRCGDGIASASEACDTNGNSQTCNIDCSVPACGDGKVNRAFTPAGATGPEQCDDNNTTAGDGCSATCQIETCGNGVTETINGEQCDDGNLVDTDACRNTCQFPRCGDGIASASEACDTNGNSQTCNLDCSVPACGDGKLNPSFTPAGGPGPEQCDDMNTVSGDGCSSLCRVEPFALTVTLAGAGAGSVSSAPSGITCGSDCTELFPTGTSVTLTATPGANSVFTGWAGAGCSGTGTCVVSMTAARNVVATFSLNTLTVVKAGNGLGEVTGTGIACGSTGIDCTENYNNGTMVTLVATPGTNTSFTGWSGGGCSGTGSCIVTMSGATTVTATFTFNTIPLTVTLAGNGTGTVTSVPAGINCGSTCAASYDANTVVTLTAAPSSNNTFTGWSGSGCTGTGTCQVTMSAARAVTATFTLNQHQLSVVRAGSGSGSVSSSPAGITCGVDCTENYNAGTVVTLTHSAAADSTFTGWSGGGCSGTGATCVVTVNAATSVTATFAINTFVLSVSRTGTGSGTVTSVPSGINCGGTCMATYNAGTLVTLTAVAGGNSAFTGWSGGGCSGLLACTVTMSAAQAVVANFDTDVRILTVSHAGTGTGSVSSSPAGITSCTASSGTCSAPFAQGSMVTLTATPTADSNFTGWSGGGCSGTSTCVVTMNNAQSVTATFTLKTFTLTVTSTGGGTLTSVPAGISCPGTCSQSYSSGQVVGLVAVASATTTFSGWTGACTGTTGTICYLTITAATSAGATFTAAQRTLNVVRAGGGSGGVSSSPAGITCSGGTPDCTESFAHGTSVTLTATASGGSTFTGWSGDTTCTSSTTCVLTMDQARNVTATFALQSFALTVTKPGTGTGTVTSVPSGINCGATCSASYNAGSLVQLTATPDVGSSFAGWSGGGCTGTGTCLVTMSAAQAVMATFTINSYALTVNVTQSAGEGSVTSSPAGITACTMAGCTANFNHGTSVTLTATLGAATAVNFTGCDTMTTNTCTVSMTAARAVGATFTGP